MDSFEANRFSSKADIGSIVPVSTILWMTLPPAPADAAGLFSAFRAYRASHCEHANSATDKQRPRTRRALFSFPDAFADFSAGQCPTAPELCRPAASARMKACPEPGSRRFGMPNVRLKTRCGPAPDVGPAPVTAAGGPLLTASATSKFTPPQLADRRRRAGASPNTLSSRFVSSLQPDQPTSHKNSRCAQDSSVGTA